MSLTKPFKLKPVQLRDAFIADLAQCWQKARSLHPKDTSYAFVLFGLEGTPHFEPHVLTEEGLENAAKRYIENGYYETLAEAKKELRFSIEDSPYAAELEGDLPTVNALLKPVEHILDETPGYALLAKAAIDAFVTLNQQGVFGIGKQREKLLLMIDTSFAERDWTLPSIKRLNSRTAAKEYEEQTKILGVYASCDTLTFSPDGRRLFFAGHRESDPGKEKSECEIVACDLKGLQLKRRWRHAFPRLNGFRDITCDREGSSVLAIANHSVRGADKTLLMRFASKGGRQIGNHTLDGSAQSLAVSGDDCQIVVATGNKILRFLDQQFVELRAVKIKSYPSDILPLRNGEVLVGCEKGIVRANAHSETTTTPFKKGVFRLSTDKAEKFVLLSRWFDLFGSERERNSEFGFQVFTLPKMKHVRTIQLPGKQLVRATMSPNGELIACEAHGIGKRIAEIIVFETKTFSEIARRKSDPVSDLKFSPDGRLLAFTKGGYTTSEPIVLWRVPQK
jgi:hypothetical protein